MLTVPGLIALSLTPEEIDLDWNHRNNSGCCPIGKKVRSIIHIVTHVYVSIESFDCRIFDMRYKYILSKSLVDLNKAWAQDCRQSEIVSGWAYLEKLWSVKELEGFD